jgi:hypothetical protein
MTLGEYTKPIFNTKMKATMKRPKTPLVVVPDLKLNLRGSSTDPIGLPYRNLSHLRPRHTQTIYVYLYIYVCTQRA